MKLTDLSNDELIARASDICREANRLTARLIVHLVEVEERRLDLEAACTSMLDFCVRRLGMSRGVAYRRLNAARLVRRFPSLLERIERGELHLSTLVLLRPHLTEANVDEIAESVKGKSQREVEGLLARVAPSRAVRATPKKADVGATHAPPVRVELPAEDRCGVRLTVSAALREKLERARDRMMHRNPTGDLTVVVERALDLLLDTLEAHPTGQTTPRVPAEVAPSETCNVVRPARREVCAHASERCTFLADEGRRRPARLLVERDDVEPGAPGSNDDVTNNPLRFRAHERSSVERASGQAHVARHVAPRRRESRGTTNPTAELGSKPSDSALRGLVNLGLARASRAITEVYRRHANGVTPASTPKPRRKSTATLT
jgi:hypothetical protein